MDASHVRTSREMARPPWSCHAGMRPRGRYYYSARAKGALRYAVENQHRENLILSLAPVGQLTFDDCIIGMSTR